MPTLRKSAKGTYWACPLRGPHGAETCKTFTWVGHLGGDGEALPAAERDARDADEGVGAAGARGRGVKRRRSER